jgi:hypothetical protein
MLRSAAKWYGLEIMLIFHLAAKVGGGGGGGGDLLTDTYRI